MSGEPVDHSSGDPLRRRGNAAVARLRQTFPKQLLPVTGDRSLLQQTAERLPASSSSRRSSSAAKISASSSSASLRAAGAPIEAILLEPVGPKHGGRRRACRLLVLRSRARRLCC